MILLDTHIWIRWLIPADPLPGSVITRIESASQLGVSAISCWEVAMLVERQRLTLPLPLTEWIDEATQGSGVEIIPVSREAACLAALLPQHHRDPADRIIIATALCLDSLLISFDEKFSAYFPEEGKLVRS